MDAELELLFIQVRKLRQYAEELMEIRSALLHHRDKVDEFWISHETEGIDDILDRLGMEIKRMSNELYDIGHDMIKAYEKLEEEEEQT